MLRTFAHARLLTALLLLLAGQLGIAASAQATTCPRAALHRAVAAHVASTASVDVVGSEHQHSAPATPAEHPAVPSTSCGGVVALPERVVELLLPSRPAGVVSAPPGSPPVDLRATAFFRPPRPS